MAPPFTWYQTLHKVEIEVKFAYRHDVAGCATLANESYDITAKRFKLRAECAAADSQEQTPVVVYELDFELWAAANAKSLKVEKRPVGKVAFSLEKEKKPARWRTLYSGAERPPTMRLDLVNHENVHYSLWSFKEDSVDDFEGHDLVDRRPQPDAEDMSWLFPPKGPGEFKQRKKKSKRAKADDEL